MTGNCEVKSNRIGAVFTVHFVPTIEFPSLFTLDKATAFPRRIKFGNVSRNYAPKTNSPIMPSQHGLGGAVKFRK